MNHLPENTSNEFSTSLYPGPDSLLAQLYACEEQLQAWLNCSEKNAAFFAADPVAALRQANIGMDEEGLQQLASILSDIKRKLA